MIRSFSICLLACVTALAVHAQDASVPAEGLPWKPFEEAVDMAKQQDKKLLVDVYAPWCPWCRRLQREVYTDETVQSYLTDHFIVTRLDGENELDSLQFRQYTLTPSELAEGLGAEGYPTTVFLDSDAKYITRLPGFIDASEFMNVLSYIGSEAFVDASYKEYLDARASRPD